MKIKKITTPLITKYNLELILKQLALKQSSLTTTNLIIHDSIPSTNDYLLKTPWNNNIMICLAETQTKGKGRLGRSWYSPPGENIYLSIGIQSKTAKTKFLGLSLIVAIAIIDAIKDYGITANFAIKWPNDILFQQQKVAGILIDTFSKTTNTNNLIIGVGLNLNMLTCPADLPLKPWISLQQITGKIIEKNIMTALLIYHILNYFKKLTTTTTQLLTKTWKNYDYLFNKLITIKTTTNSYQGTAKGIDPHGNLILLLANGQYQTFSSGDTTILLC